MSTKPIIIVAVAAVCLFFAWRFLGPVVCFLFPRRVSHRHGRDLQEPDDPLCGRLKELGFIFLGVRIESVGWLWRRKAAVYVLDKTVAADLVLPPKLKGSYLMTFWPESRCALTRVGSDRTVEAPKYHSAGAAVSGGFEGLLQAHRKTEAVVGMGDEPRRVKDMQRRLELASEWYRNHARAELSLAAALGAVIALGFLSFGIYAIWLLSR
jgi:hypothetical protein